MKNYAEEAINREKLEEFAKSLNIPVNNEFRWHYINFYMSQFALEELRSNEYSALPDIWTNELMEEIVQLHLPILVAIRKAYWVYEQEQFKI